MSLVVEGYKTVAVKKVNLLEREGKKPLVFIELVDPESFESTGEMMYLNQDADLNALMSLKSLERKKVKATLRLGTYNNRPSVNITNVTPL